MVKIEEEFMQDVQEIRKDYLKREKVIKIHFNVCSILKYITMALIPIISYSGNHLFVLVATSIVGFFEFLPSFFKWEFKLRCLNEAITKINYEFQVYYYDAEEKYTTDNSFNLFVQNVERIKYEYELKTNNNYDLEAFKKIETKAQ